MMFLFCENARSAICRLLHSVSLAVELKIHCKSMLASECFNFLTIILNVIRKRLLDCRWTLIILIYLQLRSLLKQIAKLYIFIYLQENTRHCISYIKTFLLSELREARQPWAKTGKVSLLITTNNMYLITFKNNHTKKIRLYLTINKIFNIQLILANFRLTTVKFFPNRKRGRQIK